MAKLIVIVNRMKRSVMEKFHVLKKLIVQHKYQLAITYTLFTLEAVGGLLRFYFFGQAINDLIKGNYGGLVILVIVHLSYIIVGTIRHMYDTRTYTAIYTSLVTKLLNRRFGKGDVSRLSAHSVLAREFVDFLEHDLVYVIEAFYNLLGSLIILMFYDKMIVFTCISILVPVIIAAYFYGRKMNILNRQKNDELELQVDIIVAGNKKEIHDHYSNLRKWQIKISDKEAMNFGLMELMVMLVIVISLLVSRSMHNPALMAGSLFGIYSYILKFASGLDTIPYTIQRLSSLSDITKRIELQEEELTKEKSFKEVENLTYRALHPETEVFKISA